MGIIDQQLFFGSLEKKLELLAGIQGADDEVIPFREVAPAQGIGLKQLYCLLNAPAVFGNHPEAAAVLDIQISEIEGQHVKHGPIDDHKLVVVADEIIRRARHRHPRLKQSHLKLPELFFSPAV